MASAAVVAVWLAGAFIWGRIEGLLMRTVAAQQRTLEDSFQALAMVVREEALVIAPASGSFQALVSEGSRVRAGAVVASLMNAGGERLVYATAAGNVHFYWDGWEQQVDLDLLLHRAVRQWREVQPAPGRITDGQLVQAGQPVARIVHGHVIRLYLDLPAGVTLASGQRVEVRMPGVTDQTVGGRVVALGSGEPAAVLVELDRYLPVLDAARWVDVEVVRARYQGLAVPAEAIVWEAADRPGVYVRRETRVVLRGVRIVGQAGGWAVVDGISAGDEVITNPGRVATR